MKKRIAVAGVMLVLGLASCGKGESNLPSNPVSTEGEVEGNLLSNGSFSEEYELSKGNNYQGLGAWGIYGMAGGLASFAINADHQLVITSDLSHAIDTYSTQLNQKGVSIAEGAEYTISFDIYAKTPQTGTVMIQQDYSPYSPYFKEIFSITQEVQHFSYTYTSDSTDENCSFVFNLGKYEGENVTENTIVVDNITWLCTKEGAKNADAHKNILVNQIGYLPDSKKTAVFRGNFSDHEFDIINTETNEAVYHGTVANVKLDFDSRDYCGTADFSDFTTPGKYILRGANNGDSYEFEIKEDVYSDLLSEMTRMLYLQRCGCEVSDSTFGHTACHTDTATIYGTHTKIDVTGGWHDAGDYGKYIVSGAKTVEDLLLTYENYSDISYTTDTENAGNLLDEAAYELDWMLKMQNEKGEVYHKVSSYAFPGTDVLPEDDHLLMVVAPVSYAATADFAAVMAHAAKVYGAADTERASKYKEASLKAFNALSGMEKTSYKNPSEITTGEYPDDSLNDEYLWAAAELYGLTKENSYMALFESSYDGSSDIGFGWDNMTGYAYYSYLKSIGSNGPKYAEIRKILTDSADVLVKNISSSGYKSSISGTYVWGSNMSICNSATLFLLLDDLGVSDYTTYVQDEINYLLGENTIEYCFVTGFGSKSPKNPHHRVSIVKQQAVPGMLVGGPDNDFENNGGDSIATAKLQNKVSGPASYIDHNNSWSTNEVTIYWNSPMILVLAGKMAEE